MNTVKSIFEKCMLKQNNLSTITASDISVFITSPFLLWCNHNAPKDKMEPESKFNKMLQEFGSNMNKKS